jgi:lipopolysaccharide transport system permease protein
MNAILSDIWAYRGFILSSIKNDFKLRVARSKLGSAWIIVHPLAMVAIYAFVLSAVLSAKLPGVESRYAYAIYLTAGFLGWTLFSDVIARSLNLFIDNANLLKKIVFPKVTLPLIVAGSSLLNYAFLFAAILLVFALLGHWPGLALAWIPAITVIGLALALGIGLLLGIINVFIRDLGQAVPVILQLWFWLTPVVYPLAIVPEAFQRWIVLNPMYPVVAAYQDVLVFNRTPDIASLAVIFGIGIGLLAMGLVVTRRASAEMVDVL